MMGKEIATSQAAGIRRADDLRIASFPEQGSPEV